MAKKRRSLRRSAPRDDATPASAADTRTQLNVNSWEDVADSEDEFFLNRDKVLLDEGPARKKLRKLDEEAAFFQPSDEDVLPIPDSDGESIEEEADAGLVNQTRAKPRLSNGKSAADDDDIDVEDDGGWGDSKRDYYDVDRIETEADAIEEEKEALRLQRKQLQDMTEADYGLDEADWLESDHDVVGNKDSKIVQEVFPELDALDSMSKEEQFRIIATRYPEFEPLRLELITMIEFGEIINVQLAEAKQLQDVPTLQSLGAKQTALMGYTASLAMYFAILSSGHEESGGQRHPISPLELREHPIMEVLLTTRKMWERIKDMEIVHNVDLALPNVTAASAIPPSYEDILNESAEIAEKLQSVKKGRKSKAQSEAERVLKNVAVQRAENIKRVEMELNALSKPESEVYNKKAPRQLSPPRSPSSMSESDFGEADALTAEEAEAKARRKHGLRFYTSKITAKSLKRDRANRDGGDTDIPYRERLRDRQARLNAAAEKRGNAKPDARTALGMELDSDDQADGASSGLRNSNQTQDADDEDYYDLVATRTQRKKEAKAAGAAAQRDARIQGRIIDDGQAGPDQKREITYAMAKNKGLTPKRSKEGRNPRVKKRNRYEEKMKKLGSMRPVYKGGEGRGGYGGEKTGIRKNLVKSVKL